MSEYLYQLRTGETYNKIKNDIEGWLKNMEFGSDVLKAIRRLKGSVKYLMVPTSILKSWALLIWDRLTAMIWRACWM